MVVIVLSMAMLIGTANAGDSVEEPSEASSNNTPTVTAPLTLDCSSVPDTDAARKWLTLHNLCGYGSGTSERGTVVGNCGSLTLTLFNDFNQGVQWRMDMTSTLGPMIGGSFTGFTRNLDTGGYHSVSKYKPVMFTTHWTYYTHVPTGSGIILGEITSAISFLLWGATCTASSFPTDVVWVN